MIIETIMENGLVQRSSDRGVLVKNEQTGLEYTVAVDLTNDERIKRGITPYSYVETEKEIEKTAQDAE